MHDYWHGWGVNSFWWIFYIGLIVVMVWVLFRIKSGNGNRRETPLDILKRRFAKGEINEEEYMKRKRVLQQD